MDDAAGRSPVERAHELVNRAWTLRSATIASPPGTRAEVGKVAAHVQRCLAEAVALFRTASATTELAAALGKLAHAEEDAGRHDAALAHREEAVEVARRAGHPMPLAHAVRHLGDLHRKAGRLAGAEACYAEALALYARQDAPPALDYANALRPMAILSETLGRAGEARILWRRARDLYGTVPVKEGVAECTEHLARLG
ncbi:MAG: tetratricopeptide repeat protein [Acidobacteria bacterium]|nr:tetratricopeptide repeat protein [Acidobacteriota bacterium]MYF15635.1 tetratricopeptide repeat protein [Acidobacteriota bacterium]MYI97104.1 tetratricopeptide repeat protein [Acidobacteriota bacterium]